MKKIMIMAAVCLMAAMTFAAQCAATTKKGMQCKRRASPGSEFCWQHGGTTKAERAAGQSTPASTRNVRHAESQEVGSAPFSSGQCQATTKKGAQCKRRARVGEKYCTQHAAMMGSGDAEAPTVRPTHRAKPKAESTETVSPASSAEAASGICQGKTKSGEPCKRKAKPGSKFCWQHDK